MVRCVLTTAMQRAGAASLLVAGSGSGGEGVVLGARPIVHATGPSAAPEVRDGSGGSGPFGMVEALA